MIPRLIVCLLLALASSSCASSGEPDPDWRSIEVDAVSERFLWIYSLNGLQRLGFPVGTDANPTERRVRTGWKTDLAPFRGDGRRQFAELFMEPVGEKRWSLSARVVRPPLPLGVAGVQGVRQGHVGLGGDPRQADILLQTIRSSIQAPLEEPSEPTEESTDRP